MQDQGSTSRRVSGVVVVGHGSSSAQAIVGACRRAVECVDARVVERTKEAIADAG